MERMAESALSRSRGVGRSMELAGQLSPGNGSATGGNRVHAARLLRWTQFAEGLRFLSFRAGGFRRLGSGDARYGSRQRLRAASHGGSGRGGIQDRVSPAYWGEFVDFT